MYDTSNWNWYCIPVLRKKWLGLYIQQNFLSLEIPGCTGSLSQAFNYSPVLHVILNTLMMSFCMVIYGLSGLLFTFSMTGLSQIIEPLVSDTPDLL